MLTKRRLAQHVGLLALALSAFLLTPVGDARGERINGIFAEAHDGHDKNQRNKRQ